MSNLANETLEWRDVPGFVGRYAASQYGDIWSLPRRKSNGHRSPGRLLSPAKNRYGYLLVNLIKDGKAYPQLVHRIVCRAFNGPAPAGKPWVLHGDGNPSNNDRENLRWGTPKENVEDSILHGTYRNRSKTEFCSGGHLRTEQNTNTYAYGRYCRDCARESRESEKEKRLAKGLEEDDLRHGTLAGYGNWGCRCFPCMEVKRIYQLERRRKKRQGLI